MSGKATSGRRAALTEGAGPRVERLGKKFMFILIIALFVVQILLKIPAFRVTFCVVEQLEGRPVEKPL